MAKPPILPLTRSLLSLCFSLLFLILLGFIAIANASFTPTDHYLLNCGSSSPSTTDPFNRNFAGDESVSPDSVLLFATRKISLNDSNDAVSNPIHCSVRIFTKPSAYAFRMREKGTHLVRLHFRRFKSPIFDLSNAQFHVVANGYLLNNVDGLTMKNVEIKEYILWVNSDKLEISFIPLKRSKFGFINAIEVISAPKDLILDIAQFVDSNGEVRKINGVSKNSFETIYRVNVGGPKLTPFNDSLWRTWIPDDSFLISNAKSREFGSIGRIRYQIGGVSREIGPDHVYASARVISASDSKLYKYNLTWGFPVPDGYKYLVRTHFCDIASYTLGSLYFNVYVNGFLVIENLDLSTIKNSLASPYFADFIVDGGNAGVLSVSIGPSKWSSHARIDAILNGVEVFKLNNSMKSFDGLVSAELIMRPCYGGNGGFLVPTVTAAGLLVVASVVLRRKITSMCNSVPWSRLTLDVSEVGLKSDYR